MTKKAMKLDRDTGLMECRICGHTHFPMLRKDEHYVRGAWQCPNGCKLEDAQKKSN
jgi:hypothetical protein